MQASCVHASWLLALAIDCGTSKGGVRLMWLALTALQAERSGNMEIKATVYLPPSRQCHDNT